MSFISFHENYYRRKLEIFENKILSRNNVYEVQQLLKILDDLTDEGYTNLNNYIEKEFLCLTRLRRLLEKSSVSPMPVEHAKIPQISYCTREYELKELIKLVINAKKINSVSNNPFLAEIYCYSKWIGYGKDTAYIFLWLINRRFLENIADIKCIDDDTRLPIYDALESGNIEFKDLFAFCKNKILAIINQNLRLKKMLFELLSGINEQRIMLVESGYMATIPIMLEALDDRIEFKLYMTAPFLYKTYPNNIFCRKYENVRKFETIYSHDLLIKYSSYCGGKFYVNMAESDEVISKSLEEMKFFV